MIMKSNVTILFSSVLAVLMLFACERSIDKNELYGYYTPIGYKNNFDTIQLQSNGKYHRKVYNTNKQILLDTKGVWSLERNHIIHFHTFYLNLDDDLIKFPESISDTSGGWRGDAEYRNGSIQFCVGYYEGENCYQKVK